jgi:hypothetical protein
MIVGYQGYRYQRDRITNLTKSITDWLFADGNYGILTMAYSTQNIAASRFCPSSEILNN